MRKPSEGLVPVGEVLPEVLRRMGLTTKNPQWVVDCARNGVGPDGKPLPKSEVA